MVLVVSVSLLALLLDLFRFWLADFLRMPSHSEKLHSIGSQSFAVTLELFHVTRDPRDHNREPATLQTGGWATGRQTGNL